MNSFRYFLDKSVLTPEQIIAKKHVSLKTLTRELKLGISDEKEEHTTHSDVARHIALGHLSNDPHYYSHVNKIMKDRY
jgi:hypothetical protein